VPVFVGGGGAELSAAGASPTSPLLEPPALPVRVGARGVEKLAAGGFLRQLFVAAPLSVSVGGGGACSVCYRFLFWSLVGPLRTWTWSGLLTVRSWTLTVARLLWRREGGGTVCCIFSLVCLVPVALARVFFCTLLSSR